jgi:hypothetical protein
MVVESVRRVEAIAMRAMMTTATIAMIVQAVGDIVDVVVFVVVVVVELLVVAPATGAWFWVWVVVDDESVVACAAGSARATIKAGMWVSLLAGVPRCRRVVSELSGL